LIKPKEEEYDEEEWTSFWKKNKETNKVS